MVDRFVTWTASMSDWRTRARALADEQTAKGTLSSPAWQQAMARVPRHELVPNYYEYTSQGWRMAETTSPQERKRWLGRVYSNAALFILAEGRASSSMPSLTTRMLFVTRCSNVLSPEMTQYSTGVESFTVVPRPMC
jgi:hypothetical protein